MEHGTIDEYLPECDTNYGAILAYGGRGVIEDGSSSQIAFTDGSAVTADPGAEVINKTPIVADKGNIVKNVKIDSENFNLDEFLKENNAAADSHIFYKEYKSVFPPIKIDNNTRFTGTLQITLFDNNVIYIKRIK
jgi:hypothetical protein